MIIRKYCAHTDAEFLYQLMNELEMFDDHMIGSDEDFADFFEHRLRGYYSDFYIAEDPQSKQQKGFLCAYDHRANDGHCHFDFHFLVSDIQQQLSIVKQVLGKLFREYPLNRVFIEAGSDEPEKIAVCDELGACEQAVLKEYRYRNGHYADVRVMSLTRKQCSQRGC